MKISAGMQPYFFPYLGYFDLIYNVEKWVVFDTPQYIREGWVNRNRVLHPEQGWRYLIVPVKKYHLDAPINQILICEDGKWRIKMLRHLHHYKKYAPFYRQAFSLVEECLAYDNPLLYKLNVFILEKICTYLDIPFAYSVFSEMNLDLGPVEKSGDWALRINEALGVTTFINPPGGRHLYDPEEFQRHGIRVIIREFENMVYPTGPYQFEPALSIIDVMMWNSKDAIHAYLESKKIVF